MVGKKGMFLDVLPMDSKQFEMNNGSGLLYNIHSHRFETLPHGTARSGS